MRNKLHTLQTFFGIMLLTLMVFIPGIKGWGQTTVFSDDFSTNTSATWTTTGAIGASAWSVNRSGADWGARRNISPLQLEETNDVGATPNVLGWVYSSVLLSSFSSPFNATLSSNSGLLTWTFNFRTNRTSALAGFTSNTSYGMAMVLVSTSNTPNTTGSGYAVVMGGGGLNTIGLIAFNNGLQGAKTTIVAFSGAPAALTNYMSVKVTYNPTNNLWELFNRDDGSTAFADPLTGTLNPLGTGTNSTYTGTLMTYFGAYWQGSTTANQTAFFDNVVISSTNPSIALSSSDPAIPAANITQGTNKNPVYKFTLAITNDAATLTKVNFTTGGTYAATDVTRFQLWYNTTDNLSAATQVGSDITTTLGAGAHSFSSLSRIIPAGTTGYFWISADLPGTATLANTINVAALTTSDLFFSFGTKSGTAYAGGDQTIVAAVSPNILVTSSLTGFGSVTVNTYSAVQSYTVSGSNLSANIIITPPSGFQVSTSNSPFTPTNPITLTQSGGTVDNTTIYTRFAPELVQVYSGIITHISAGADEQDVAVSGTGISPANPAAFTATPFSSSQINLLATANTNGNDIVVVFNATGTFSTPADGIAPGNAGDDFAGGTIHYKGSAASLTNHTGLSPNQLVYYKVFSMDALYFYSGGSTANATTLKLAPTIQASNINFTSVGNSIMTVNCTAGDGDRRIIKINTTNSFTDPVDNTAYTGNPAYSGTGEQVVYSGTGTSVIVNGLLQLTNYWFRVYEYNNSGTNSVYLTTTASGNPNSQTTTSQPFFEDFEYGTKGGYAVGNVNCTMGSWNMDDALIGNTANDKKNGLQSVRMRNANGMLSMNFDKPTGAGVVTVSHAIYGSDASSTWKLQMSIDQGASWSDVGSVVTASSTSLVIQSFTINQPGTVRLRIVHVTGSSTARLNIDDIGITDVADQLTVSTQAPTAIASSGATGNGRIVTIGSSAPTVRGFCWDLATNPDPDILDSKVEETGTFPTGPFTGSITGLTPGLQYKVRAYATDGTGTVYGSAVTFYTLSDEPATHAASFSVTSASQSQIDLAFSAPVTITNASGYLVLQKTNSAPTGAPSDATGYAVGNPVGDGVVAAVITDVNATSANITGLTPGTHYFFTLFPYNWDGVVAATYNYKTDGTVPGTDATTAPPLDATSEVSGPALILQPNPLVISSLVTSDAAAVHVFDMNIYDYATTDAVPTKITQVTIKPGTGNTANWANVIQGIKLSIDGGTSFVTTGTPAITASSMVIPVTSGNLNIPNGEMKTLSLYIYLKSSGLTDNQVLEFKVDAAASSHGFTADPTASTFIPAFTSAPVSNTVIIEVIATSLKFVQQPTNAIIDAVMSPDVTIEAADANNNRDLNSTGTVDLISSGTMTGPVTASLSNGFGTFGSIVHTASGTGITLTASVSGLSDAVSSTFAISPIPTYTELVVPKYMGSKTTSSANTARTSVAFCIRVDDLLPNTSYDLKLGLGLTSEGPTVFGAGNVWKPVDGFGGTASSTIPNAFTTGGTGSSGPVWVIFQPTGNGTRFDAGQVHNLRIGCAVNGSSMPSVPAFVGTKTITALDIATTARTPGTTTDDGAFIKGSADPSTTGKYVLLFDNVNGTGDPLFSYQIRQATATSTTQSELPVTVNDIYMQGGTSAVGDYPAVVPIGANNPNGVQRVEGRNADNTISGYNTDEDGNWPSGVNTTTLARRDVGIITVTDAPLVIVNKTFTLHVLLEGLTKPRDVGSGPVYPPPGTMFEAMNELIEPKWGSGVADTITVEFFNPGTYTLAKRFTAVQLLTNASASITVPGSFSDSYWIRVSTRNHVAVWSSSAVSFTGSSVDYDFTDDGTKAFENSGGSPTALKSIGSGKFAMWVGSMQNDTEVVQFIDTDDASAIVPFVVNGDVGYLIPDMDGGGWVDIDDAVYIDTNLPPGVYEQRPQD